MHGDNTGWERKAMRESDEGSRCSFLYVGITDGEGRRFEQMRQSSNRERITFSHVLASRL